MTTAVLKSYITTIEEFETRLTGDPRPEAVILKAAADAIQTWYLQRATAIIDALPLRGRKYLRDNSQIRAFPREYMTPDGWYPDCDELGVVTIPENVLIATVEEALAIYDVMNTKDRLERSKLQQEGVTGFNYTGTSEQFVSNSGFVGGKKSRFNLCSIDAYNLLKQYILRAAPIT